MSTTAKDIIQAAVASRTANDPGALADKPEMIRLLSRKIQGLYAKVSEAYPQFFAESELVVPTDAGWAHPLTLLWAFACETVAGVQEDTVITVADIPAVLVLFGYPADQEDDDGPIDTLVKLFTWLEGVGTEALVRANMFADYGITDEQLDAVLTPPPAPEPGGREVAIVPLLDKQAEEGMPRIYQLSRFFHTVGEDGDPIEAQESEGGESLTFFGPLRHPALDGELPWDDEANTFDPTWPEHRNDLLVAYVKRYLTMKDSRGADELKGNDDEIAELEGLLMEEARIHHEYQRARRFTDRPRQ